MVGQEGQTGEQGITGQKGSTGDSMIGQTGQSGLIQSPSEGNGSILLYNTSSEFFYNDIIKIPENGQNNFIEVSEDIHIGLNSSIKTNDFGNIVLNSYNTNVEILSTGIISPIINKSILLSNIQYELGINTSNGFNKYIINSIPQPWGALAGSTKQFINGIAISNTGDIYGWK